ncbi:hypothetical protein JKP88DRAFT_220418 [Tribonema minus]|uniref:Uncharacterized protein n=1 Tax=Tribonema minus TaxID=303371 RepID=A0A835YZA6_9STRA|nr:hypothetical protein JKP88DRAFT_220418 [Tribonema minus]|eukprot:TRINITY_DN2733_c0_g1_i1.p2 TRINITY_DN2733_c0_g1~~TRINITY_DN2733_c0_g1_i1.p2  ORF type:complete len:121 (-),score=8.58 TRINITY_DN2733_c0_g1_i1:281-643(-)
MLRTCAVSCARAGSASRAARGQVRKLSSQEVGLVTPNPTAASKPPAIPVAAPAAAPAAAPVVKRTGSSLRERLASFLVGAGVGLGLGYYHLNSEVEESTAALLTAIDRLQTRLEKAERKK